MSLGHVRDLLAGLNRQQRQAVTHGEGPLLVLAGPGTGKTEVITRRVAWLIATKRALPRQILALTFTNKAAAEMQARVDVLVPYGQADTAIHTFHAFGDRILREYAFELGLLGDMRLLSRTEAISLLREQLFELGLERYRPLGEPDRFLGALVDLFWRAKDEGVLPADFSAYVDNLRRRAETEVGDDSAELRDLALGQAEVARAYTRYQALLAERGLIDHADQVLLCLRLLRERPHVRRELHERFRYLLVDEFQDTNPTQLELVLALAGGERNVTVVGDDDQAIYAFRGAAIGNMRRFTGEYRDTRRVVLRRNYRSRRPIIDASQRLIGHNDPGRLAVLEGVDKKPVVHRRGRRAAPLRALAFATREAEADTIAREIADRIAAGASASDFAVLVRTNGDTDSFVRSLAARGVPVRTSTGRPLHDRPETRVLLAYLRVLADPTATVELYCLATAEPYSVGGGDLTAIMAYARRRHRPLWEVLQEIEQQPGILRLSSTTRKSVHRLVADVSVAIEMSHSRPAGEVLYDFLRRSGRLARLAAGPQTERDAADVADIVRFFETVRSRAALLDDGRVATLVPHLTGLARVGDQPDEEGPDGHEAVAVLTVHRAKGLEFRVVFMCGLVEGRFPSRGRAAGLSLPLELRSGQHAVDEADDLAEERRLFYVGMTRARDELVMSYALEAGGRGLRRVSPFVAEAVDLPATSLPGPAPLEARLPVPVAPSPIPARPRSPAADAPLALSFSQLEDYFSCPERYRLRHVVRVPTPPHHALVYGNALHQAVAAFHLRQARGELMSEEELVGVFAAHWSAEGFLSRAHEEARYAAGRAALIRFRQAQIETDAPAPTAVERQFTFAIGRDRIRGRMDRLDEGQAGAIITDYKSSDVRDQRKADQKARESLQLQVYALAHEAATGELPREVQLHFLDSGVVGRAAPDRARLERTVERVSRAANEIRAQQFRAKPNPVTCGYCPFRAICAESAA